MYLRRAQDLSHDLSFNFAEMQKVPYNVQACVLNPNERRARGNVDIIKHIPLHGAFLY